MSGLLQEVLVILTFWFIVLALDLRVLYSLRRSQIDPAAKVMWAAWAIGIPVVGALSYFIARPAADFGPRSPSGRG